MRSRARHPTGPHGRLAQKPVNRVPHCWGRKGSTQFALQFVTAVTAPPLVGCVIHSSVTLSKRTFHSTSSCSNGKQSSIEHLLTTQDTIILSDLNAHHLSWYSRSTDTRGTLMDDSLNGTDNGIHNWDTPTRVLQNVLLESASLITSFSWQTISTLSSDHLPILIRLQMKTTAIPGLRRTDLNLKKAYWDRYRLEVETALSKCSLPTYCQRNEKIFPAILLKAASHHIPTTRGTCTSRYTGPDDQANRPPQKRPYLTRTANTE